MAVAVDLTKVLDKEWQHKSLAEILAAPVSARFTDHTQACSMSWASCTRSQSL